MESTKERVLERDIEDGAGGIVIMDIVSIIRSKEAFVSLKGASPEDIAKSEEKLNIKFTKEYVEYVSVLGAASYYEHELTGVCDSKALSVVEVTNTEKQFFDIPEDWYVIEKTHIDGIVYWQSEKGAIYMTAPNRKAEKVCESLSEYVIQA